MGIYKYEEKNSYNGIIHIKGYYRVNRSCLNNNSKQLVIHTLTEVTPLFCSNCNKQVPGFYKLLGSRYGHVGEIECERCNSTIYITDNDNMGDELHNLTENQGNTFHNNEGESEQFRFTFDYATLYYLNGSIFNQIEKITGFQLLKAFESWADLSEIIECICKEKNYDADSFKRDKYFTDARITNLPVVIHTWLQLLTHLGILDVKNNLCYLPLENSL